jgi:signal transduction histidine kinase/putative methionine-R-sulfoxide reductase with GAF domain
MTASPTDDNASPEHRLQELIKELSEAREQQASTAEILRVISSSPMDLRRVFAEIAASAAHLCDAHDVLIRQLDGDCLRLVAHHGLIPRSGTLPLTRGLVAGRAVLDRRTIHVADIQAEADGYPEGIEHARRFGYRSILAVPLIRTGHAIGVISIRRADVRPFTDRQIDLLKTFADQAVIAIENTRLFEAERARTKEVETKSAELVQSLEYQTAISAVLAVISRSPNELQPVLNTIVMTAATLCASYDAVILLRDGDDLRIAAHYGPMAIDFQRAPIGRGWVSGRAVVDRVPVHVHDLSVEGEEFPLGRAIAVRLDQRTCLGIPLLREGQAIGCLFLRRTDVNPYSEKQINLLKTFADQAVIAIENTRLFEEVQARTSELTEALEQQTATSEVLGVISRSKFDLQPVFETMAENAVKLCQAERAFIFRFDGNLLRAVASYNVGPELRDFVDRNPIAPGRYSVSARAALELRTVHVPDVQSDPEYAYAARDVDLIRTVLAVPLLRGSELLGTITIYKLEAKPFTENQIALVETFADQAVIAIENARLFEEVQARNRDLTALGEVGRAVSSTLDLKVVLKTVVERAVDLSGTDAGSIFYYREETGRFELGETMGLDEAIIARLRKLDIAARDSGLGEAIALRRPLLIPDLTKRESNPLRAAAIEAGFRAALIVPLLSSDGPLGTLVLQRRKPGEFPEAIVSLMQSFADQSAIALENARLFEEIAQKSRELEIASQHKSQFVANMSHELRTPLAAILGYAELMQEGFYEPLGQKSLDALTRIRSNGKHLLGLINTVLDIAKIESGQFTLNMTEYAIESVVETVRSATESLAQNKKLSFKTDVAKPLPVGLGDEQRLTQVLLNLVGNAIKFTDAGEVSVTARAINGHFSVSVSDTGPGIPVEHQTRIFEQFQQVDNSNTRAKGGTGLGLAIAKQIVEMHGGRIWVESTPGKGSTFQMELPTRAEFRKRAL